MEDELVLDVRDIRLVRRLVRDYFHRANPLDSTLDMWVNVVESEKKNILPFKREADCIIDSTILYEPNLYENCLGRILAQSKIPGEYQERIGRVQEELRKFIPLDTEYVPADTVLREFLD